MKSLVLKDLYNIGNNVKTMVFMLIFFAAIFIPNNGPGFYVVFSGVLCCMMVVTTFHFDEQSHWQRYALTMPITPKALVKSKFLVLFIFSIMGIGFGLAVTITWTVFFKAINHALIAELFAMFLVGFSVAEIFGSTAILLIFKYGIEKSRIISIIAFMIPSLLGVILYNLALKLGLQVTDKMVLYTTKVSPLIAFLWQWGMYRMSYYIFMKQDKNQQ